MSNIDASDILLNGKLMKDEISLIKQIKNGNSEAFDELYKMYYGFLLIYAKLFLDKNGAEDVIQDVFLNVWLHKDRLEDTQSCRGYLLSSVYNTSLNVLKHRNCLNNYRPNQEQEIEDLLYCYYNPDSNDVIRNIYNNELRIEIETAIKALSPKRREIFSLSYLYDKSNKEICEQLGVSLRTVENHIYVALKQLRGKLYHCREELILLVCGIIVFI